MSESSSIPGVFIIESLQLSDEKGDLYEGKVVSNILHLNKVENQYFYIRTEREFEEILKVFEKSKYRYLHISCHGADNAVSLTLDNLTYGELGNLLQPYLKNKRLFLSACSSVNSRIAVAIIPKSQCYSIIGPEKNIEFRDATIIWASFYHLMFKENATVMLREKLIENIQKVVNTFQQPMMYYSRSKSKIVKKKAIRAQATKTTISEAAQIE